MIYEYELACKEAGLSEEKIKEIRRMFDAEKKRLKRRKVAHDKCGWGFFAIEDLMVGSILHRKGAFDIPDAGMSVEEEIIHRLDLERLNKLLEEMDPDDKEFLLDCFESRKGTDNAAQEKHGLSRGQVQYRKRKLVNMLREKFEE
jgi:hypothetical protein